MRILRRSPRGALLPLVLCSLLVLAALSSRSGALPEDVSPEDATPPLAAPAIPAAAAGGFVPLRAPVLGFAIERQGATESYRVVRAADDGDRTALATGSLEECETAFLAALEKRYGTGRVNLAFPTFGGKQLWGDRFVHCGWRIQENAVTGHCRLLDAGDVRRAWGDYEQCRVAFERHRVEQKLRPAGDHLVLLVHGLFRSRASFERLADRLRAEGFDAECVSYPSTRATIREHAAQLEAILDAADGFRRVSFVAHSLGGVVVRDLLAAKDAAWRRRIRPHRVVMLGTPNQGSAVAALLEDWLPYRVVAGAAGQELTAADVRRLPAPDCEFGIIAGGTGGPAGLNPLLAGDNDGVVHVEDARLDGAADFLLVDCLHSFLPGNGTVVSAVHSFLARGKFAAEPSPRR